MSQQQENRTQKALALLPATIAVVAFVLQPELLKLWAVLGLIGFSAILLGFAKKGQSVAFKALLTIFIAVFIGVIGMAFGAGWLARSHEDIFALIMGYLFMTMLPFWSLLGSYKIVPIYDDPKKLYGSRILTSEEFRKILDTHLIATIILSLAGLLLMWFGWAIVKMYFPPSVAHAGLAIAIAWLAYLAYTRRGILNIGAALVRFTSNEIFRDFERKKN